jgi:hypothetical protein
MAKFTKTFTYALPDDYLAQTDELGKTGEWTYEGPAYMYVFVKNDTGLLSVSQSFVPAKDAESSVEEASIRAGLDQTAVLLDIANNDTDALIASFYLTKDTGASTGYPQKEYALEDGTVYYSRPEPTAPDHTYDVNNITYDFETGSWQKPFPWHKPWMTTEQHMQARDGAVTGCKERLAVLGDDLTPEQIVDAESFIAEMEDLYEKFAGVEPHMIPFPMDPTSGLIEGYDYNEDPDGLLA